MNYVDAFKTAPFPFLDLCPHAWNKLAYSGGHRLCNGHVKSEGQPEPYLKMTGILPKPDPNPT